MRLKVLRYATNNTYINIQSKQRKCATKYSRKNDLNQNLI